MVDLTTNYLGLTLKNPLVPSASPLSKDLNSALRLEDAGAAAIVMYSLFARSQAPAWECRLGSSSFLWFSKLELLALGLPSQSLVTRLTAR